jgi:hypothetical protein
MVVVRGRMKYVPGMVLIELQNIKEEDGFLEDHEAFKMLTKYAREGRALERNFKFNLFKKKIKL